MHCFITNKETYESYKAVIEMSQKTMKLLMNDLAWPCRAAGSASDSRARGPGFNTWSGHILPFLFPLIQVGQLSVSGKTMCIKYWLTI